MKNPILSYSFKSVLKKKKQTILSVICICVFIACATIAGIIIQSFSASSEVYFENTYGIHDGIIKLVSNDNIEKLKNDARIDTLGCIKAYASMPIENSVYDDYVVIGSLDKIAIEHTKVRILEGRWAEAPNEIVLENSLCSKLRKTSVLGTEISFPLQPFSSEILWEKKFIVVGICSDYSDMQGNNNLMNQGAMYMLPNAIVQEDIENIPEGVLPIIHSSIKVAQGIYPEEVFLTYVTDYNKGVALNAAILGQAAFDLNEYIIMLLIVLFIGLMFAGAFSLYSNYAIARRHTFEQIFRLKIVGISTKELYRFFIYKVLFYYIFAVPIGLALGLSGAFLISQKMLTSFIPFYSLEISAVAIITVVLVTLVIVLFLNIVPFISKVNEKPLVLTKYKKTSEITLKTGEKFIKKPLFLWGIKSMIYNSEKIISIIISFAIFTAILLFGIIIYDVAILTLDKNIICDYSVEYYQGEFITTLYIPSSLKKGISQEEVNELEKCSEVKSLYTIKTFPANICILDTQDNRQLAEQLPLDNLRYFNNRDEADYERDKKAYGYEADEMLFLSNIYGCSEQLLGLLKSYVVSGSIEAYNNENQPKVIVVEGTEKNIYRVGDEIVFTQQLTKDMQSVLSFDTYRFDIKTTVGAIVRISQDDTQLSSFLSNKPIAFLVHDSVLDIEGLTLNYSTLWLTLADENSYTKTEELLRIIKDAYPESNIISQRQTANSHRLLVSTFRTVIVSLICVLFVFSLFSLNNTLQQKLNEQKRLWGMLRALGLACKHAVLYQSVEIIILNIFAWLVGCGFSAIFIIFLVGTNAKPWFEIFPWTVSLIILISNLLFCILISAVSIRRLYKYNISETIQSLD